MCMLRNNSESGLLLILIGILDLEEEFEGT